LRNYPEQTIEEEFVLSSEAPDSITIRPAQLSDIPAMLRLINDYASRAIMLPRTELELCESLRDFLVAVDVATDVATDSATDAGPDGVEDVAAGGIRTGRDQLVACGALHFYTPHMAELRSLAVAPQRARSGLGRRMALELLEQAREIGVDVVFAFTYVPGFFEKLGFQTVDRGALPLKAWKDCVRCPKFHACDEIAMAYQVTPGAES